MHGSLTQTRHQASTSSTNEWARPEHPRDPARPLPNQRPPANTHRCATGIRLRHAPGHTRHMPFMYIVQCADQSFYVGSTWDLERRLAQHNTNDEGAAYTRRRRPVRLVYFEHSDSIADAYAREKQVQGWGRAKRIALIEGRLDELPGLSGPRPD